jgi:NAD(P)-dependent dehydrogenase (short-subunit alcohol dehydrogenase family)
MPSTVGEAASKTEVVLSGRNEVQGEQVVKEIRAAGGQAYFVQAELYDEASARALAARAKELVGPIDVLVNNAGIYPFGPAEQMTEQDFDAVYDVNVKVPFFWLPRWRRRWPSAAMGQSSTPSLPLHRPGVQPPHRRSRTRSCSWQANDRVSYTEQYCPSTVGESPSNGSGRITGRQAVVD